MNISSIFIRRPIATILLSVALAASGLFAYRFLPVAALPEVDFPIITVSAKLPGAAPDTMANAVATPLIKQFSTIQSISTISSTSTLGSTQITLEFDLNRNIDQAAADVEAAIASTLRKLPSEYDRPAQLPENQSGRCARCPGRPAKRYDAIVQARRLR